MSNSIWFSLNGGAILSRAAQREREREAVRGRMKPIIKGRKCKRWDVWLFLAMCAFILARIDSRCHRGICRFMDRSGLWLEIRQVYRLGSAGRKSHYFYFGGDRGWFSVFPLFIAFWKFSMSAHINSNYSVYESVHELWSFFHRIKDEWHSSKSNYNRSAGNILWATSFHPNELQVLPFFLHWWMYQWWYQVNNHWYSMTTNELMLESMLIFVWTDT